MALDDFYARAAHPKVYRIKPKREGLVAKLRAQKWRKFVKVERTRKQQVRILDQERCRWPNCQVDPRTAQGAIEVAHAPVSKGMGGDPQAIRTTTQTMLCMCHFHHQRPRGLHSGLARIEPLTKAGTRGPVECFQREATEAGRWYSVGISYPPPAIG